jgi:hypothetical protein
LASATSAWDLLADAGSGAGCRAGASVGFKPAGTSES